MHYDMETMASESEVADLIGGISLEIQGTPRAGVEGYYGATFEVGGCGDFFYSAASNPYPAQLNGNAGQTAAQAATRKARPSHLATH